MKLRFSIASCFLLLLGAGCGGPAADYGGLNLVNATGTIRLDGEPLSGAVVMFEAADGQFAYGLTDSNGGYSLQLDSEMKGVVPGDKTVRISTTKKILGLNSSEGGEADPASAKPQGGEKVPGKYNKASELKVTVTPDKTQYDFELASK